MLEADDKQLKSTIAHNLAVMNMCEVQDHNDRVESEGGEMGQYISSKEADEAISKQNKQKAEEIKEEKRIKAEVD